MSYTDAPSPNPIRERDLYVPVRDWLREQGYTVYVEIFDADIVAIRGEQVIAVELKRGLTGDLFAQLQDRARWADEVWAAVGVDPAGRARSYRRYGFGLLSVVGGKVRQHVKAKPQPWDRIKMKTYRLKRLAGLAPAAEHHVAGLPACRLARQQRLERDGLTTP